MCIDAFRPRFWRLAFQKQKPDIRLGFLNFFVLCRFPPRLASISGEQTDFYHSLTMSHGVFPEAHFDFNDEKPVRTPSRVAKTDQAPVDPNTDKTATLM